jgi:2-dehydro-3-deoxyphosphogluconate aldolase/(4S)-4-hydroxy-2-oxoglutarate aldolase
MTRATIEPLLRLGPVIPVIVIDDLRHAVPLAESLIAGGLRVLEVTLRTPVALEAIRAMADVPGAIVGAGTVLDVKRLKAAAAAGAHFAVSPGLTASLALAADAAAIPLLPGAVTPSEVMAARDAGYRFLKFFPAEASGGTETLRGYAAVFEDVTFCPTGGIGAQSARHYLELPNVACVGGSWMTPASVLHAADWVTVTQRAREAAALRT